MGFFDNAWKALDGVGQEAGKHAGFAAQHTRQWIKEHPGETTGMIACVLAAPLGIGAAHSVLRMVGFTAKGVAVGSAAAAAQSSVGNVAAGSTFAVLQSAAAGGGAAILVNGVAAGTITAVAIAATAPGLIKAMQEGKKEVTVDGIMYEIEDKGEVEASPPDQ
ncbi:hypothetical protein BKA58DRAFT_469710 [Alternaria rosae]|uniref:uncharacterized protein n=1 Tax=Alternaria rosae TaxID=1187941 RepID=UPI001E8CEF1D|nr:uncharacterized protein BKA58DRAFT_469710 [Alternaria rosae]KAH6870726.1 hypothetical protein BKA58DRAFT_469710 [Alternaria rosae]